MIELDLHKLTVEEALRDFVNFYNRQFRTGSRKSLRIIHGYGSSGQGGKILRRLRAFLADATGSLDWKPGDDVEGNPGVTIVYPRKALPAAATRIESEILAFCSAPRPQSKIEAELRQHPAAEVKQAIRKLVRQGQLKEILKAGRTTYIKSLSA